MAAYADSTASFKSRALQIQLTQDDVRRLRAAGIKNFNHLAFSVSAQPGQLDDAKFAEMLNVIEPRGATLGVQAALRQLALKSLTIAVAAIRQRVEHPGETSFFARRPIGRCNLVLLVHHRSMGGEKSVHDSRSETCETSWCMIRKALLGSLKNSNSTKTRAGPARNPGTPRPGARRHGKRKNPPNNNMIQSFNSETIYTQLSRAVTRCSGTYGIKISTKKMQV